ncbi:sulfite exporter TauE/SafE family protein [Streptomyces sp. NPDC026672]|uniref:sulfite exporter TauE/SafE family protein n=1 Tax=unclassified Streptomyces TaxID=2593676 RepID=UPI0033DD4493
MTDILIVVVAGLVAGALNAVGGGGTFVALPALVLVGLEPVTANAASTIALVPGAVASAWVYRHDIRPVGAASTRALGVVSVVGGVAGACLLLVLPSRSFGAAVPWLLAFATLLLIFGRPLTGYLGRATDRQFTLGPRAVLAGQFVLAVYGGYFGGAVGIMMLALWSLGLGIDTSTGNPMRVVQLAAIYLSSATVFLFASPATHHPLILLAMVTGAVAGGFAGARLARRLPPRLLRGAILTTATTTTVLYFARG